MASQWTKLAFLFALVGLQGDAFGQQPPSGTGHAWPPGARAGTKAKVILGGPDWTPDSRIFSHDSRVNILATEKPGQVLMHEPPYWFEIKSYLNDPRLTREVSTEIEIPKDYPSGPFFWSVANANGVGSTGMFMVGNLPEVMENEDRKTPQPVPALPVTINGRLRKIEEVDRYLLRATKTGLVHCELTARKIGSDFNAVLEVFDAKGEKIAEAFDTEGTDPILTFVAGKDKDYVISVRDVDYRGYRNFTYRLTMTDSPRVITTLPASGASGAKTPVEFIGIGLATGQPIIESITREVTFAPKDFTHPLKTPSGAEIQVPLQVLNVPTISNKEKASLPFTISRRMTQRGEQHRYKVQMKKGETWVIAAEAHRFGSPMDPSIIIHGPDGKMITSKDDSGGLPDIRHTFLATTDGEYVITVMDQSGKVPNLSFIYQLSIEKPLPDFQLKTAGVLGLPLGAKTELQVSLTREAGFKQPVSISITGLPKGVKAPEKIEIGEKADSVKIPLESSKDEGLDISLVTITGTAKVEDQTITRVARGTMKGGSLYPGQASDNEVAQLLFATTMKAPFKVKPVEADGGRRVPRGATHLAELIIERTDGFHEEITLDMAGNQSRHRQGIFGPAMKVAGGTDKIEYPVFPPEWLETTRTSRLALVAMGLVKDPKGKPHWLMVPMDGQITMSMEGALMKLTSTSEDALLKPGDSFAWNMRLMRNPKLDGTAKLELIVPEPLKGLVRAKPMEIPKDQTTISFPLEVGKSPMLVGEWMLTARVTLLRNGHPVISEANLIVEFTPSAETSLIK